MKFPVLISFLLCGLSSFCQIWREPFDTLTYYDNRRLTEDMRSIRSYSITRFDPGDSILQFDYNGYNEQGYLTEEFMGLYPEQKEDSLLVHYYYNQQGIFQESSYGKKPRKNYRREFLYNERHRLIDIATHWGDSSWHTRFYYSATNLLDSIRYSPTYWTTFSYDKSKQVLRKECYEEGRLKEYFNYQHPDKYTLIYQNCLMNNKGVPYLPCEVTEGTYDKQGKLIKIVNRYDMDSSNVYVIEFEYDPNGKIIRMLNYLSNGSGSDVIYTRDKNGLLLKIDYYDPKGTCYMYEVFDYEFR